MKKTMTNTQPALIRAFFSAFTEGILSAKMEQQTEPVTLTPQLVKATMLDHYETISKQYFDLLFNPLALIHYDSAEELIAILRSPEVAPTLKSPTDLFRHVCRTEESHDDMVAEYRRNFTSLLSGKVLSLEDFFEGFPDGYLDGSDEYRELEVRLLTQVVVRAFFAGRKAAGETGSAGVNQAYLFRLLMENMQCLLHKAPVTMDDDIDLTAAFRLVCRDDRNFNAMLQAMQEEMMQGQ